MSVVIDLFPLHVIVIILENREGKGLSVLGSAQGHEEGMGTVARSRWEGAVMLSLLLVRLTKNA